MPAPSSLVTLQLRRTRNEAVYSCPVNSCLTEKASLRQPTYLPAYLSFPRAYGWTSHYEPMGVSASLCLWPSCCIVTGRIDPERRLSSAQTAPSAPF
ncbi:hypothetical protein LX36DRAFT_417452 [Colletotrichum falcatum]|nr:hypothetical protein LX36DRAFT_417452 [Colletotrichum falcatum]